MDGRDCCTRRNLRFIETPADATTGAGPVPAPPAARTFTQEEVNAIAAREKDQGAASAQAALAAKLTAAGITDLDAAIALAAQSRTADDARKIDAERDRDAAIARADAAESKAAATAAELRTTQITAALTAAGASAPAVAARAIIVPEGADPAAITAAVDALKGEAPGLFTAGVVAPHSDGGTPPAPGGSGQAAGTAGLSEAERRYGKK